MRGQRPSFFSHMQGIAIGIIVMTLRLVVLFAVLGAGYAVYVHLGVKWFHVFIFAAIAVRLHLEIVWIERHFANEGSADRTAENPFRKR